ncbi:MAG: 30S ribosomal protein S4 [Candidatus Methanofastidiosia archaeon]
MGDPKKHRKKYETPSHPWQKERIERERELMKKYGLKNKKELWKAESKLRRYRRLARRLLGTHTKQTEIQKRELLSKLERLGILKREKTLDSILGLSVEDILDRRLQSIVFKKGLGRTVKQARQMIVHGNIRIGDRRMRTPGLLVDVEREKVISSELLLVQVAEGGKKKVGE